MNSPKINSNEKEMQSELYFRFFSLFQHSGDSLFLFPLVFIIFIMASGHTKVFAGIVFAGMILNGLLVFALKQIFRKERPEGTAGKMYRKYDRFSFPSGHAARVWAIVTIAAFFYWPLSVWLSAWALLISYSRLKLKLHDFTDVIAGSFIGVLIGVFTVWVSFRLGFY